ncbi:hypothetical protein RI054_01g03070 [Pseudoscourfieldia marina]
MATTTGEYRAASTTLQVCTSKHDATHTGDGTTLTPKQEVSVHDVTQAVRDAVIASGVRDGSCHLLAKHTTVGLTLNESEARLERDYEKWLLGLAPNEPNRYEHNDLDKRPERPSDLEAIQRNWVNKGLGTVEEFMALEPINAHAHLLASLLGSSLSIPVIDGELAIGQWQSVLMVELDGPRNRTLACSGSSSRSIAVEIALAGSAAQAAEAEQKGKKAAEEGGEPTLDYVVPASYPDARHAESLPTTGIPRRGKPTLLSLPSNPCVTAADGCCVRTGFGAWHPALLRQNCSGCLRLRRSRPQNGHLAGDHDVANAGKNAHALRSDAPSGVLACDVLLQPCFRSGFASAVTAMNVSPDRRNYIAGGYANSHAVGTHYVDNSVVVDDAARFLFGHLIGLPPPPVEVPVALSRLGARRPIWRHDW